MDPQTASRAQQSSFDNAKPRAVAVFEFLKREVLEAAADGQFRVDVSVSDALYYDAVFQHLVVCALASEGVAASFAHGTWHLSWAK